MTPRTKAGRDYADHSCDYGIHENTEFVLAIEAEAFALGKRLGAAHGRDLFLGHCDYDLNSLQPDGYHLIPDGESVSLDRAKWSLDDQRLRVKCAGVVE